MVLGVDVHVDLKAIIIFAIVNAFIGLLINILLRYQGQKYAEIENDELCKRYYNKKIKERKYMSMEAWFAIKTAQDVVIKGGTTAFSIFGIIYITITGSKNPIQILITLASLILFACFGLISMNSAYTRFYNIQVPYMEMKVGERSDNDFSNNILSVNIGVSDTDANSEKTRQIEQENLEMKEKEDVKDGRCGIQESSRAGFEEQK